MTPRKTGRARMFSKRHYIDGTGSAVTEPSFLSKRQILNRHNNKTAIEWTPLPTVCWVLWLCVLPFLHNGQRISFTNRQRLLAGAVAGAFPDIDYMASWVDPMIYLTLWHRSITHSFLMLPLWALLLGTILSFVFRRRREWRYLSVLAGFPCCHTSPVI